MSLEKIIERLDDVGFNPRTLEIDHPQSIANQLSVEARGFFSIAYGKNKLTAQEWTEGRWIDDPMAMDFFFKCSKNTRTEILLFLTLFIHEYTHKVDFLISPFGFHFFFNSLREYWKFQHFFPRILDDPKAVEHLQFLVGFDPKETQNTAVGSGLTSIWGGLKDIIHMFYAWGDVTNVKVLGKYIKEGWSDELKEFSDPFGVGIEMELVKVLDLFYTFRPKSTDKFWYLKPLSIFETKAITNSMLYILYLFKEKGVTECLNYYESIYLPQKSTLPKDYFFLLDMIARIFNIEDFHELLKKQHYRLLSSSLFMLSGICWYALQAPPPFKSEDPKTSNPIIRLWCAFLFVMAVTQKRISAKSNSMAEMFLDLENTNLAKALYQIPIKKCLTGCSNVLQLAIDNNNKETWHPDIKKHFDHIFKLMAPHVVNRPYNYISYLGMPQSGNPFFECRTKEDWEITYDDYILPEGAKQWFDIRTDFLFHLLKPKEDFINKLDQHFLAFLMVYNCNCGASTEHWVSRHSQVYEVNCQGCGLKKSIPKDEFTIIRVPSPRE